MQLDFVILGMLAMRRFSGYDLRKWMEGPLKYIGYGVQLPQIYRRLAKLVGRGWVEYDIDTREGGPDAKLYRMTEAGRRALWEWARSPFQPSLRPADPDFAIRFIFGGQLDPDIALRVVRTELEYRQKDVHHTATPQWLAKASQHETNTSEMDPKWAAEVHMIGHEHGYAGASTYIAWLQLVEQRLLYRRRQLRGTRSADEPHLDTEPDATVGSAAP
ncbi:PadR family transcriptional regulator [Yinghuangia sp. YIM S09857]|uniref:PadR family transcriptional regulator n=1 Tax=Yinghuangia sp. YIM S09857 TaxID=3436929 RepID=UPI003F52A2C8